LQIAILENELKKAENDQISNLAKATVEAPARVYEALAQAESIKAAAESQALSSEKRITILTSSLTTLATDLNLSPRDLITYQYINSLEEINKRQAMNVNLGVPKIIQCLGQDPTTCP
jgi:hypothetical protein